MPSLRLAWVWAATAWAASWCRSLVGDHHQAGQRETRRTDGPRRAGTGYGLPRAPVTHAHAIAAGRLPPHHRDPFDRMLVAQAVTEGLTLASRDESIPL